MVGNQTPPIDDPGDDGRSAGGNRGGGATGDGYPSRARQPSSLAAAMARLRRDPVLFVPFVVAGLVLSLVDWLRLRDPIPVLERDVLASGVSIDIEFTGYPTGVGQTTVPLESLVGLELPYLGWGIALYLLPLVVLAVAGAVTIARAMGRELRLRPVLALFGFVVAIDLFHRLTGSIDTLQGMGLWGLAPMALFLYLLVRLFPAPGLFVAGRTPRQVIEQSIQRTAGRGWSIFGLILLLGLSAWLLATVPVAGTLLSTAVVAPLHAVAIVAFLDLAT